MKSWLTHRGSKVPPDARRGWQPCSRMRIAATPDRAGSDVMLLETRLRAAELRVVALEATVRDIRETLNTVTGKLKETTHDESDHRDHQA